MRALLGALPLAASLALVAGCADPAAGPAVPTGEPVAASGPGAAAAPGPGSSCTGPSWVTVRYPAGWVTNGGGAVPACSMFGADDFPVVPASDVRTAPIAVGVEDLPFDVAAAALPDETGRAERTVDGHRAVRIESVAGPGLWPEGTPSVRWVVDLGASVLVADAVGLAPFDHARDVEVLDAMAAGFDLGAAA
jgi:hypothetical protein